VIAVRFMRSTLFVIVLVLAATVGPAQAKQAPDPWGTPAPVDFNVAGFQDGCPIESPDGRSLYFASTRPRFRRGPADRHRHLGGAPRLEGRAVGNA
jgi:hypothetical protein